MHPLAISLGGSRAPPPLSIPGWKAHRFGGQRTSERIGRAEALCGRCWPLSFTGGRNLHRGLAVLVACMSWPAVVQTSDTTELERVADTQVHLYVAAGRIGAISQAGRSRAKEEVA